MKYNYPPVQLILGTTMGRRASIRCPTGRHRDSVPSFVVYADGSYHCFGCGEHGKDSLDFLIKVLGNSFKDSIVYLEDRGLLTGQQKLWSNSKTS